jgi:hypothetical protein
VQDAYKSGDVGSGWLPRERISSRKINYRFSGTNHDLTLERQFLGDRRAQRRVADLLANHERADCANVDEIKLLQVFGELSWPAKIGAADIDPAKKDDRGHNR